MLRTITAAVLFLSAPLLAAEKPLMRDFIGLNTHTVQHRPELYQPIASHLRDYHGIDWDLGGDSSFRPAFPMSRNKVNWKDDVYGKWRAVGATVDVSLMFEQIPADKWKDLDADARAYGKAFASYFGPSHQNLVQSMEIGNEPGGFSDADYRRLFIAMAKGLREGDPKLKIVTGNMTIHKSDAYSKNVESVKGLDFDVLNTHTYAQLEPYPTWRRSYPEDKRLKYLTDVQGLIDWRNKNAPGKPLWITEFGYDSTTKPNFKADDAKFKQFKDWVGNTDTEQAQYIVRSWLLFSAMDVERAYLYWFNDNDTPHVHAASGLTRNYQPKPSYWAARHLQATLGEYRFSRKLVEKEGELYTFEYVHSKNPNQRVFVAWSPTAAGKAEMKSIAINTGKIEKIERMPLTDGPTEPIPGLTFEAGVLELPIDGSPVYIFLK